MKWNWHKEAKWSDNLSQIGMMFKNWYKQAQWDDLYQIAKRVRSDIVKRYNDERLREKCLPASKALQAELIKKGYDAIVVKGLFRVDKPDPIAIKEMEASGWTDGWSEEDKEDAKFTPLHYWVEVGNKIVDITASQFNDELDTAHRPIIISPVGMYGSVDRYIPVTKDV